MAESFINTYQRLFELQLFHHYWLDDGGTVYDLISDQSKKERILRQYDVRSLLAIKPTVATAKALQGFGALFRETATGFIVISSNKTAIPSDTVLDFIVTIRDPAFFNYTALTLQNQRIYAVYSPSENTTYRCKENVAVFSSLTGATRGSGQNRMLFLSSEIPALSLEDQVESLFIENTFLYQLTSDQLDDETGKQQLGRPADKAVDFPVFFNQADLPLLTPPEDIEEELPARGIMLTEDIPDNVFALIRCFAVNPLDDDFSFIDNEGKVKSTHPVYHIRVKSRSTWWKYIDRDNSATLSDNPLPLTYFGNAGTKQKPSAGVMKVVKNDNRVTQLVSEIFV